MTTSPRGPDRRRPHVRKPRDAPHTHRGHGLMMMICCISMILVALVLVATGAAGSAALLWALACMAMMAVMMFAMGSGHDHR